MLSATEKSATITIKETVFEWVKVEGGLDTRVHPPKPLEPHLELRSREVDKVWALELNESLKKTAKTLHEKEIVVTGKCLVLGIRSQADTGRALFLHRLPRPEFEADQCRRDSPPASNRSCCLMSV